MNGGHLPFGVWKYFPKFNCHLSFNNETSQDNHKNKNNTFTL